MDTLTARTFTEFVKLCCRKKRPVLSQSELGRRAGFSSRSTVSQYLTGKRSLSYVTALKLEKALELSDLESQCYWILVELENPGIRGEVQSSQLLIERLHSLQVVNPKHRTMIKPKAISTSLMDLLNEPGFLRVFASLSSEHFLEVGEISQKADLKKSICLVLLNKMVASNLAEREVPDLNSFRSKPLDLDLTGQKKSQVIKGLYMNSLKDQYSRVQNKFDSDEHLFYSGFLGIRKADLPQLKSEIKEMILSYVQKNQQPDGDQVRCISVAMY